MKLRNIVAVAILALAVISLADARSSGSSFRSAPVTRSAPSSFRSSAPTRPTAPATSRAQFQSDRSSAKASTSTAGTAAPAPKQTFRSGLFQPRQSVTNRYTPSPSSRNTTVYHEHHYFGYNNSYYGHPGYYGGYRGGFGDSPFFWLWLFDRPQTQVVYATSPATTNGSTSASSPVVAQPATTSDDGPSFLEKLFNIVLGLALLSLIGAAIFWIISKAIR